MSKKDVDDYFLKVCEDYHNTIETLHDVEEYVQNNILPAEKLDEIKAYVEVVKNNYLTISYIMHLLEMPVNPKKHNWYENTHKCDKSRDLKAIREENAQAINNIKGIITC